MNIKRYLLSSIAAFIFIFIFDFIFHGNILVPAYERTADLWRTQDEMNQFMHWMMINELLYALIVSFIFTRHYEGKGITEGLRFGLMIGTLIGFIQFAMYAYLPIPFGLALAWFIGSVVQFTIVGIILSLLYRKKA